MPKARSLSRCAGPAETRRARGESRGYPSCEVRSHPDPTMDVTLLRDKVLPVDVAYPASDLRICADQFDEVAVRRLGVVMRKSQMVRHGVIRSILQLDDARPFDGHPRRVRAAQKVALRVLVDRRGGREEPHLEPPLAQFAQPFSRGLENDAGAVFDTQLRSMVVQRRQEARDRVSHQRDPLTGSLPRIRSGKVTSRRVGHAVEELACRRVRAAVQQAVPKQGFDRGTRRLLDGHSEQ
eukprot:scaffold6357_cov70-Phaeocystis_antarctica.AAC.2